MHILESLQDLDPRQNLVKVKRMDLRSFENCLNLEKIKPTNQQTNKQVNKTKQSRDLKQKGKSTRELR